jgi:NTP pyrophosphatase (non-canonical NTP hydrolase)
MNFKEYIEFTRTTIKYDKDRDYEYCFAGLISELGELIGAYAKCIRGDYDEKELRERMKKELGDCLWMLARLVDSSGHADNISYSDFCLPFNNEIEKELKSAYSKGVVSPNTIPLILDTIYCADSVFSVYNTNSPDVETIDIQDFCTNIGYILNLIDFSIEEVVTANVAKLSDRLKYDKIKGDGEDRVNKPFQ